MKKKIIFLIYPLLLTGIFLVFASSCQEEKYVPVLTTTIVTDIAPDSVISGGIITSNGGSAIINRGVCWSTGQTPTMADNKTTNGTDIGSFTSTISDLTANTTYYIRAYATNKYGTGYGMTLSFTTKKLEDYMPILSTKAVTNITLTSAISGGNITSDKGSRITARGVCWSIGQTPTIADSKTTNGTGIDSFTCAISGLTTNTIYYVRAYATNSYCTGYGDIITFSTMQSGTFTDNRDNKVYKWVQIGNQVWMAENLGYLPNVVAPETGSNATPNYYVYDYVGTSVSDAKATTNYSTFGVLYNWQAAKVSCPKGWHLPSDEEWTQLTDYLGGNLYAGLKLKEMGSKHWKIDTYPTNETGFTALPGGARQDGGIFFNIGYNGYWWSATENFTNYDWSRAMSNSNNSVDKNSSNGGNGFSIRCVKD
jgi:uncharacterized protein (TIGR02145 family)